MKKFHRNLIIAEARKLERQGYIVELEKLIAPHCVVDIFAQKAGRKLIVECGFCCRSKERMTELRQLVDKVIHVPYLSGRAYLYPWKIEMPWQRSYEQYQNQMDKTKFDWTKELAGKID